MMDVARRSRLRAASGALTAAENSPTLVISPPGYSLAVVTLNVTTLTVPDADDEVDFYLQTCYDQAQTWNDLANVHFANGDSAVTRFIVIHPEASATNITPSAGAIADNTVSATRPLGWALRIRATVTGGTAPTYAYNAEVYLVRYS